MLDQPVADPSRHDQVAVVDDHRWAADGAAENGKRTSLEHRRVDQHHVVAARQACGGGDKRR